MSTRLIGAMAVGFGVALTPNDSTSQAAGVAFVDFNVVPMTRDTVLRHHTVLVAGGKVTAVGPTDHSPAAWRRRPDAGRD